MPSGPGRTPLLRTPRLILEPLCVDHAGPMLAGLSDPALYRYLPDRPPADADEVAQRFARMIAGPAGPDLWRNWVVRRTDDPTCLGTVQLTIAGAGPAAGRGLVGIMIFPAFWRQGIGREALAAMLDCLFEGHDGQAADALVDTRNEGSLALFSGLGFRIAGRREDADFFDGQTSHEYELVLDRADWRMQGAG